MKFSLLALAGMACSVSAWSSEFMAQYPDWEAPGVRGHAHVPGNEAAAAFTPNATQNSGYFTQLIDHKNPSTGTFQQFYYWSSQYWKGPGSPVIMFTPGEINATGYNSYLTTARNTGLMAQELGAAVVVMEHRYWGNSSPYPDLTTANMKYLTLDNAIHDLTYFAQNFKAPWSTAATTAKDVPWVLVGGSYSGALSAWTESVAPGTYWAYSSSSAPVEAISDYAGYFYPVQEGMAKNCSNDLNQVIDYMDLVIASGDRQAINNLKAMFKLENVTHDDDFMAALENGPWLWQGNQFYTGYSPFFQFCDYVENAVNSNSAASPYGVGVQKALAGYASWFSTVFLPNFCSAYGYAEYQGEFNTYCFNTYDPQNPMFTDTSLSNQFDRQWEWMLCNEPFGYWQDGAPFYLPTVVSRTVTAQYWIRQCGLFFPKGPQGQTYGIAEGKTEAGVNAYTGGWNIDHPTRLVYNNGGYDPWRNSGVSSDLRPQGPLQSTSQTPVNIVPGGFHCSDMIAKNAQVNAGCQTVLTNQLKQISAFVAQWPSKGKAAKRWEA